MKKLMAVTVVVSMLLSLGALCASASEIIYNVSFVSGVYAGADPASFSPVGEIIIQWDEAVSQKVDMTDGDVSDWVAAGYNPNTITPDNMVSWVGGKSGMMDPGMPEGWQITSYYVGDPTYLYMAFDIIDSNFAYGSTSAGYNGDAIQLAIDFGGKLGEVLEKDPDIMISAKNIFYSFTCVEDGQPIEVHLQESDQDGILTEANGNGVKGAARRTEKGWSVELALSWDMMYQHYVWKAWEQDAKIYVGSDEALPLTVNMNLSYLNRMEAAGEITWAASTTNGIVVDDQGTPGISWTPHDNGIQMKLPWREDLHFDCEGIATVYVHHTMPAPSETETPYDPLPTEPAIEEETMVPDVEWEEIETPFIDWTDTVPPEWEETLRDAAEEEALEDELNAILEKYGCSAVAGMGSLTALAVMAAAAFVWRKKD